MSVSEHSRRVLLDDADDVGPLAGSLFVEGDLDFSACASSEGRRVSSEEYRAESSGPTREEPPRERSACRSSKHRYCRAAAERDAQKRRGEGELT